MTVKDVPVVEPVYVRKIGSSIKWKKMDNENTRLTDLGYEYREKLGASEIVVFPVFGADLSVNFRIQNDPDVDKQNRDT